MLVGISEPTMSNRDLAPNVSTSLLANGTMSAAEIRSDSPCSQVAQPEVPCIADAFWTAAAYCEFVMSEKFVLFGAAAPERNGTSWSGLLTLSATQAMSQLPVPKMVCCRAVPLSPLAVTLTPADCHCFTASSAAALTVLPAELSYRKVRVPGAAALRAVDAAPGSDFGSESEAGSPGQATGSRAAIVVAGEPFPDVITFCSAARSRACVSAIRIFGSLVAWPEAWLYHCSPIRAGVFSTNRFACSRRVVSGPRICAEFRPPEISRLAAVVSFEITLTTMLAGSPGVAVVAPSG